jgi:hypothetical protein
MSKFMLLYNGPVKPMQEMNQADMEKMRNDWQAWMESVGSALVEMGSPMGNGRAIMDDSSDGSVLELTGYSIVEASDINDAVALVDGHPFLVDNTGKLSVQVFELYPAPAMQ